MCLATAVKSCSLLISFKLYYSKEVRNGAHYTAESLIVFPFFFFFHQASSKATLVVFMGNLVPQMVFSCGHFTAIIDTNKMVFYTFFKGLYKNQLTSLSGRVILAIRTTALRLTGNSNI